MPPTIFRPIAAVVCPVRIRYTNAVVCRGFSLVEMLVSAAVFSILLVILVQMLNGATRLTGNTYGKIRADAEARSVFDRIFFDQNAMIKDSAVSLDVAPPTKPEEKSQQLTFGAALGQSEQTKRGLVANYVLTADGVQRRIRDIDWSETALGPLTSGTDDAQILGQNVVGMVIRVILSDGTVTDRVSTPSVTGNGTHPTHLVVGLALANRTMIRNLRITDPTSLVPPVDATDLPSKAWSSGTGTQLRFYQHIFRL